MEDQVHVQTSWTPLWCVSTGGAVLVPKLKPTHFSSPAHISLHRKRPQKHSWVHPRLNVQAPATVTPSLVTSQF